MDLDQAYLLREYGWRKPILLLEGIFSEEQLDDCVSLQCDMVVHHLGQVEWLLHWFDYSTVSHKDAAIKRIRPWLKLNSGMNRLGLSELNYRETFHKLHALGFQVNHLTHFANSDELGIDPTVDAQLEVFQKATQSLSGERSLANSGAILWHRHTLADWCRPGIMLYGASPTGKFSDISHADLKPTMLLRSQVISIQEISSHHHVGYGGRFTPKNTTRIAVIACGYADGYPRHAPDGTPVWIGSGNQLSAGQVCPLAGRVSMDMITVDVSDMVGVQVGTPVELWGEYVPIDDVASASGTVGYELMCALASRVPVIHETSYQDRL